MPELILFKKILGKWEKRYKNVKSYKGNKYFLQMLYNQRILNDSLFQILINIKVIL